MKQLEGPYQYEKEISMWRLSSHIVEVNGTLELQMPTLVRLPDPVPACLLPLTTMSDYRAIVR